MWRRSGILCSRWTMRSCGRAASSSSSLSCSSSSSSSPSLEHVTVVEVGPRDGLQNEAATPLTVDQRVSLIDLLAQAGCAHIEVGSFVSPKWVPAMADSDQVLEQVLAKRQEQDNKTSSAWKKMNPNVTFSCLVPNARGMQDAQRVQVDEIAIFAAASETFSQKNINCSIDESMERYRHIVDTAHAANIPVRGYLSCVVACPYEGRIDPTIVGERSRQLLDELGCYQVSLGDTIGVATAASTRHMLQAVTAAVPASQLAVHFHDTYGQAVANTLVALEEFDIRTVDAAVAGLGGCPYAPGAAGNLATEDLVYLLDGLGVSTGIDMAGLVDAADYVTNILKRPSRSKAGVAWAAKHTASSYAAMMMS